MFLAALLGGCIDLAPAYHRPASPTPATFPNGPSYPAIAAERPVVGWRDFFADNRLKAVIETALRENRDLRAAIANIAAARAQYQVQRAALFPTVTANASASYGQIPGSVAAGGAAPGTAGPYNQRLYNLTGGVSAYQLDLFGKVRDLTRAAQEQYFASARARDAAQITLVAEVATDYLTLGADRALLQIAQQTLANGQDNLSVTQHRMAAGVDSELAVSQAETVVQQARFDVARLTTQVAQDRNALELVVGAPVADDLLPAGVVDDAAVLERLPVAVSSNVLLARPDILQAEDQLRAANANIGAARAAFFPSIALTGSGGLSSLALSTLFRGASETWSFAPTASQTLFDGGVNRGNLAYAKAQRDLDLANYEKAIETAFREVADALALRGTIEEQLSAQEALTNAAANTLRLSTARYQRGADTYLNVLIAQRTLYAAQQTLVTSRLARAINLVGVYSAFGGGLDQRPMQSP
jgi:multidrug efflux system outer membrane protein